MCSDTLWLNVCTTSVRFKQKPDMHVYTQACKQTHWDAERLREVLQYGGFLAQ